MPPVTIDPKSITIPADREDEELEKDINWDALRPQSRIPLEEAQAAAAAKKPTPKLPPKRPAADYGPPRTPEAIEAALRAEIAKRDEPFSRGELAKAIGYTQTVPATNTVFDKLLAEGVIWDTGKTRRGGPLFERTLLEEKAALTAPAGVPMMGGSEVDHTGPLDEAEEQAEGQRELERQQEIDAAEAADIEKGEPDHGMPIADQEAAIGTREAREAEAVSEAREASGDDAIRAAIAVLEERRSEVEEQILDLKYAADKLDAGIATLMELVS